MGIRGQALPTFLIRQIRRFKRNGLTKSEVSRATGVSRPTIDKYWDTTQETPAADALPAPTEEKSGETSE